MQEEYGCTLQFSRLAQRGQDLAADIQKLQLLVGTITQALVRLANLQQYVRLLLVCEAVAIFLIGEVEAVLPPFDAQDESREAALLQLGVGSVPFEPFP